MNRRAAGLAGIVGAVVAATLLAFTPAWEGTKLTTYRDLGGVLTYCTGATENAAWGRTYTQEQCRAQLDRDLERHAAGIASCIPMDRLTDGQRVAFVDAAYNIGVSAFCGSSMARRARAGDMRGACDALLMWDKVDGRQVRGLTRRRQAERELCLRGLA
ncbi:lysozyme [Massilia oculi]|uniref:Lysozyme n=1 Tax=Massilia hydrophila TaxID=3044279 RepID=A0ABS7YCN5_9BURK|nr:lysozyme [Massilia oculi]MCA1857463.1 lysozyme [Massilia oculi]